MKVTDVAWRSKIGSFGGGGQKKRVPDFMSICRLNLKPPSLHNVMTFTLIGILLLISGVEMNPGPSVRIT